MIKKILKILFLGFILYLPSLFFNFSYFDDQVLILENFIFLKSLSNFLKVFETEVFFKSHSYTASYYRPILTLSFMLDAQVSGVSPFFYHLSNIIYHLLASVLFFIFLKKIKIEEKISFYISLILLVHPVLTQAVSWIPGRNDSLLTIFTLATFIFLIDYLEKRNFWFLFFYFLFFFLALLTKESGLLIPFFTVVLVAFFYKDKKNYLLEIFLGWWFIIFFWLILRQKALNNVLYLTFKEIIQALIFNSPAILLYFGKIFFPFNLSVLPILKGSTLIWGFLSLIIFLLIITFGKKINYKLLFFGLLWFFLFLIPNFIRPNTQIVANFLEHRIYLPMVGFFVSLLSIEIICGFLRDDKKRIFIYSIITLFFVITFFHQFKFQNRLVFWENAVKSSPHSPLAHRNYGVMLYFEGKLKEAEKEYLQSLKLNPKEPMVHNNLGVIYMNQKKWEKAIDEFRKELAINPYYDNALYNLGLIFYQQKKYQEAEYYWKKTLEINPDYFSAYKSLIFYYQKKKDLEKASYYWQIYKAKGGE